MTRWTLGAVVLAWAGAVAAAKPPVEAVVQGKERTPIEQALHTPERAVPEAAPKRATDRNPIRFGGVWSAVFPLPAMRLGVVPLAPPVIW
jgi:hypothetical protein